MYRHYYGRRSSWPKYVVVAGALFIAVSAVSGVAKGGSGETTTGGGGYGITDGGPNPVTSGPNVTLGMSMAAADGWTGQQATCLNWLWTHESNWDTTATNPDGGAYGIPQSLPADKMASAGADWQTDPATQIRWGLGYIQATYGNPCNAWDHEVANNWY
jgi:resuscitation-promoting factor RpfB